MSAALLEKPNSGRALAARRSYLNKSAFDLEEETDGKLYQTLISRIETGKKSVESLNVTEIGLFLKALEWTPEEFTEATGVQLPTIKTTIEPTTRTTHHIKTYSLTISSRGGVLVQNDMQTVIPEAWSGEYEAIHIPPNRILIFLKTEVVAEGQKVVLEQGGIYIGRLASLKDKTFFIELDDAYPEKTIVLASPKILGVIKEERITY